MLNTAPFAAAQKAQLDVLLGLSAKAFEGVEQITALNMQAIKSGIEEAAETSVAVLALKDPQAVFAFHASLMQPAAEKAAAYGRKVGEIVSATKAEVDKVVAEQSAGAQKSFLDALEAATQNAPEGTAGGLALFKSALSAANDAFDGIQKATRQAAEAAEANYTAVTGSVVKAAAKAKRA